MNLSAIKQDAVNRAAKQDETSVTGRREQSLSELLETAFQVTGSAFLSQLLQALLTSGDARQFEASLFCLRAVHLAVRRRSQVGRSGTAETASWLH